jgi:hypothetical protein
MQSFVQSYTRRQVFYFESFVAAAVSLQIYGSMMLLKPHLNHFFPDCVYMHICLETLHIIWEQDKVSSSESEGTLIFIGLILCLLGVFGIKIRHLDGQSVVQDQSTRKFITVCVANQNLILERCRFMTFNALIAQMI